MSHKEFHHSEETKKRLSESARKQWTPEVRSEQSVRMKKVMQNPETRKRLSEIAKREWQDPEYRKKNKTSSGYRHPEEERKLMGKLISESYSPEKRKKLSELKKKLWQDPDFRAKNKGGTGCHHSEESKEKNRRAMLGKHPSEETIKKMSIAKSGKPNGRKGSHLSDETKKKLSMITKQQWQNPESVKKILAGWHKKTRPEIQMNTLLQQLYPNEFGYNGCFDCGITIDGLVPDFPNVNGQKKVIEVFGSFNYKRGTKRFQHTEEEIVKKTARYAKYGYGSLFIWDYELKDDRKGVVQRIIDFVGKPPHDSFEGFQ